MRTSPTYKEDWASTQFCLAPLGVGWGVRLLWALEGGCVPLLASSQVANWFEDAVDYEGFSLRGLPKAAFTRQLPALLDAVPAKRRAALQGALWRYRELFLWRGAGASAYNVTMHELCLRARRRRTGVDCTTLLPPPIVSLIVPPSQRAGGSVQTSEDGYKRAPRRTHFGR